MQKIFSYLSVGKFFYAISSDRSEVTILYPNFFSFALHQIDHSTFFSQITLIPKNEINEIEYDGFKYWSCTYYFDISEQDLIALLSV